VAGNETQEGAYARLGDVVQHGRVGDAASHTQRRVISAKQGDLRAPAADGCDQGDGDRGDLEQHAGDVVGPSVYLSPVREVTLDEELPASRQDADPAVETPELFAVQRAEGRGLDPNPVEDLRPF
jgi:hypothetical protein